MAATSFILCVYEAAVKPLVSGVLSLALAVTPGMPQDMKEATELSVKALDGDKIHISVKVTDRADSENTEPIEASFEICADLEKSEMNITLDSEKNQKCYISFDGVTQSAALSEDYFVDEYGVYEKHFSGKSYTADMISTLEIMPYSEEALAFIGGEFAVDKSEEAAKAYGLMVSDLFAYLSDDENAKLISDANKTTFSILGRFLSAEERDGKNGYGFYMDGTDFINALSDVSLIYTSDEYLEMCNALIEGATKSADAEKYAKMLFGEDATADEINAARDSFADDAEAVIVPVTKDNAAYIQAISKVVNDMDESPLSESDYLNSTDFQEYLLYATALSMKPVLENSYADLFIYPDGENVGAKFELYVSDGVYCYTDITVECVISDCEHATVSPSDIADTFTLDDYNLKHSYERARQDGVFKAELLWLATMEPGDTEVRINEETFDIWYLDDVTKAITQSPAFPKMTDENRKNIIKLCEERRSYTYDRGFDTTVKSVDGSTYLPLRFICEALGFDVEWDEEQRKAYVITENGKVDMTGMLSDGKTYVKVRDFEKLGVTVDYTEHFYYENGSDDFFKSCTVKLIFVG